MLLASLGRFNEKGLILFVVLVFLTMLSLMGALALKSTGIDLRITSNYKTSNAALHLAEAGAEYMRGVLTQNLDSDENTILDKTQVFTNGQALNFDSSAELAKLQTGTTGSVQVVRIGTTNTATITSTATLAGSTQTVVLVVQAPGPGLPAIPAAVTSVSNGNNYVHSEDESLATGNEESGTCPTQPNKPGWVHNADYTFLGDGSGTVSGNPQHRAFDASKEDAPVFNDPAALRAWVNSLASQPGVVKITGMANHPTTMGTEPNRQVTVWDVDDNGAHQTNAHITGYGILILKGPSVTNGKNNWFTFGQVFNFHGLVIVDSPGDVHFSYDVIIHGAVIAVSERMGTEATSLEFEENGILRYNCYSITKYALPLTGSGGSVTTLSWRQVTS